MSATDIDKRVYVIRDRAGDYFVGWESTGWETVKGFALWTKSAAKASRFTLADLPKVGYMDLVCGFSGLKLERVE